MERESATAKPAKAAKTPEPLVSPKRLFVPASGEDRLRLVESITPKPAPGTRTSDEYAKDLRTAEAFINEIDSVLNAELRVLRGRLQTHLRALEGESWPTFEENQKVAAQIQSLANRVRALFECPKCKQPAKLRCKKPGRSKTGVFQFEHGGRWSNTTHGGTNVLPSLTLIDPDI